MTQNDHLTWIEGELHLETSYLNMCRGTRLTSYLNLKMIEGQAYRFGPDYTYVEIPILGFEKDGEKALVTKVLRNQYVRIVPACTVDVKGTAKLQVEPNPDLGPYGLFQPGYYINPGSGLQEPGFYFQARRDLEVADLKYAVRLYLRA